MPPLPLENAKAINQTLTAINKLLPYTQKEPISSHPKEITSENRNDANRNVNVINLEKDFIPSREIPPQDT